MSRAIRPPILCRFELYVNSFSIVQDDMCRVRRTKLVHLDFLNHVDAVLLCDFNMPRFESQDLEIMSTMNRDDENLVSGSNRIQLAKIDAKHILGIDTCIDKIVWPIDIHLGRLASLLNQSTLIYLP